MAKVIGVEKIKVDLDHVQESKLIIAEMDKYIDTNEKRYNSRAMIGLISTMVLIIAAVIVIYATMYTTTSIVDVTLVSFCCVVLVCAAIVGVWHLLMKDVDAEIFESLKEFKDSLQKSELYGYWNFKHLVANDWCVHLRRGYALINILLNKEIGECTIKKGVLHVPYVCDNTLFDYTYPLASGHPSDVTKCDVVVTPDGVELVGPKKYPKATKVEYVKADANYSFSVEKN